MLPFHGKLPFGFVGCSVRPSGHLLQLALDKVATQRRKVVGEYSTLDVVVLVLNNTRRLARKLLVVLHKVLVKIAHLDRYGATYILMKTREREAALLEE